MSIAYKIMKYKNEQYACVVIPTSYDNPLEKINLLVDQLRTEDIESGYILFDFIFSSGDTSERYASVKYEGDFVYNSFKYIQMEKTNPIKGLVADYLRTEIEKTKIPFLSAMQVSLLRNGYNI